MSSTTSPNGSAVTLHTVKVDGVDLFYRSAGSPSNPTLLLLHGYPSSSHQYRHILPILGEHYHVLAPDYPGFGFTTVPEGRNYTYTFDSFASTITQFLSALKVQKFAMYIFDYGAPVGMRLALQNPAQIQAIVTQNGNVYLDGKGPGIQPLVDYFNDPGNKAAEQGARAFLTYDATKMQYTAGVQDTGVVEPESYNLDAALLARPGNDEIQLALFRDYKTNVQAYPKWQEYLKEKQPPVLAIWGKDDPIFVYPGAEAFKRDVKDAEVVLLPGGHFLLETAGREVAEKMVKFLKSKGI